MQVCFRNIPRQGQMLAVPFMYMERILTAAEQQRPAAQDPTPAPHLSVLWRVLRLELAALALFERLESCLDLSSRLDRPNTLGTGYSSPCAAIKVGVVAATAAKMEEKRMLSEALFVRSRRRMNVIRQLKIVRATR